MPKLYTRRQKRSRKIIARRRRTLRRKQRGGDLTANLATKAEIVEGFLGNMAANGIPIVIHPNFPRKNAQDKYVLLYKDAELEDDSAAQKLLVIKMEKQGADFVNVSVEVLQDGVPQTFIDEYPSQLGGVNADSVAISGSLGAAFPDAGLAY
jgi:hypothetical protein